MLFEQKLDIKFRFVEDFPTDEEVDYAAQLREEPEEPKKTKTKYFGEVELHQIVRVEWRTVKVTVEREKYDGQGKVSYETEDVEMYEMMKGELGGWLESLANLSQEGKCWVHSDGYVMGAARVYGDAQVKGGAEVGDSARVGDSVELNGEFGIGGTAKVLDSAKVKGGKRMAVFGHAVVRGKSIIQDNARAYGWARVGNKNYGALLTGKARAYGYSTVKGTLAEDAEAYGRSEVLGYVAGKCWIGGTAYVGSNGSVTGDITLTKGMVNGRLDGEGLIAWPQFVLESKSSMDWRTAEDKEKINKGDDEEKKDGIEDRPSETYSGNVKSVSIRQNSYVVDCVFEGNVTILGGSLVGCNVKDSTLGSESTTSMARFYAQDSSFDRCVVRAGEFYQSSFDGFWASKGGLYRVSGGDFKESVLLINCKFAQNVNVKDSTVMAGVVFNENFDNGAVMESLGSYGWTRVYGESEYRTLIAPDEFYTILGEGDGEKHLGVKEMDGIYAYVYKYDGYHKYLLDVADDSARTGLSSERSELQQKRSEIYLQRAKWINDLVKSIRDRAENAGDWMVRAALNRMANFISLFKSLDWYTMSAESYGNVQRELLKTVESFDGETFVRHSDFGLITVDPSFTALEDKYKTSLNLY